jgi:uncharacterized surface protein with fasciclin (FAS1) repeats
MRRSITALVAGLAVLGFTAGAAEAKKQSAAAAEPAGTIVDVAIAASSLDGPDSNGKDYDLLIQAVLYTELAGALSGDTQLTVFAPNDRAFQKLVADLTGSDELPSEADALAAIVETFSKEQITDILLYHVTAGALDSAAVLGSDSLTMLNTGTVMPRFPGFLGDETAALRDPKLVNKAYDIVASNGYIHTINRVLVPAL